MNKLNDFENNYFESELSEDISGKSYHVTLLLNFFLGVFGAHRFYLGKTKSGLIMLFTAGGCGIWWLIDIVNTLLGNTSDSLGYKVKSSNSFARTWSNIFVCMLSLFFIINAIVNPTSDQSINKNKKLEEENSKLKTENEKVNDDAVNYLETIEWSLPDENLLISVEVDDYDGDVLKAGTYEFGTKNSRTVSATKSKYEHGEAPMIVDVFVADNPNLSLSTFNIDDASTSPYYIGSTGGLGLSTFTYELKKGDYVYIIPYKDLIGEPTGTFTMSLSK